MDNNRTSSNSVRVGIVGVGNCASALVQGVEFYRRASGIDVIVGLANPKIGPYEVGDIRWSVAFDIAASKVGMDLADAVLAPPNNSRVFVELATLGVEVLRGPTMDGIGEFMPASFRESTDAVVDVVNALRSTRTDVLLLYLPVGSERAARWYANCAIEAHCAVVNCIPVFLASDESWQRRFERAGLPIVGDDVKSQFGATALHRALVELCASRGLRIQHTYQLNVGGNADFLNMLERSRLDSKKASKTNAVVSVLKNGLPEQSIHVGPSDHVPWLGDQKICFLRIEASGFAGIPVACELKLDVDDSPNSAGVVVDAIRCAKLALDCEVGGCLAGVSAWCMKSPQRQMPDSEARLEMHAFIKTCTEMMATPEHSRGG